MILYTIHVSLMFHMYAKYNAVTWSYSPSNSSATSTKRALLPAGRPRSHRLLPAPGEKHQNHQNITKDHQRACKIIKPRLQSASYIILHFSSICFHMLPFSCFASDLSGPLYILYTSRCLSSLQSVTFHSTFCQFLNVLSDHVQSCPIVSGMSASSKPTACQLSFLGISHRFCILLAGGNSGIPKDLQYPY